ncbi:MAG: type IV secretion system protein, partial [Rickettsiales bacterium]|nr:type IV secretion system protein [Rickettsiales bacterium]
MKPGEFLEAVVGEDFIKSIKEIFQNIAAFIKKVFIIFLIALIVYFLFFIILNASITDRIVNTCIDKDEFGQKKSVIPSTSRADNDFILLKSHKHDTLSQKIQQTDMNLRLNNRPLIIDIYGSWTPWLGSRRMSDLEMEENLTDKLFLCFMEKKTLQNIRFSNRVEENEFYFIKNYYSDVGVSRNAEGKITITGMEEIPERQKSCWLTGGFGLYLGVFGQNGKREPSAYHHLKASKMICNNSNWFGGKAKSDNYVITSYKDERDIDSDYTLSNFKANYFSLDNFVSASSEGDGFTEARNYENQIIITDGVEVTYDMELHENLLLMSGAENVGRIISFAMTAFYKACYVEKKNVFNEIERENKAIYRFGPKNIYKNVPGFSNVTYDYGEKIKLFIIDKNYLDNYGFYRVDILSGIDPDEHGKFGNKLEEIEFFFLGTPESGRTDGIMARIFINLVNSKFVSFTRAVLVLYVVLFGFRVIFGFKAGNNKKVVDYSELIMSMFKLMIIVLLTSEDAFAFFSSTIVNFVINGTIGIVDLVAEIFSHDFMATPMAEMGSLTYLHAGKALSLAKNFGIIDQVLGYFTSDTVLLKSASFLYGGASFFFLGWIIAVGILFVIFLYVIKLIQVIIPFMYTIIQMTLVLPLAPIFFLFSFFSKTSPIFKKWVNFILQKCLELIAFFTAFYFCISIIDRYIEKLLNFKVCFIRAGDHVFGVGGEGKNLFHKEVTRPFLNLFFYAIKTGLPNNWFLTYLINLLITTSLLLMLDVITKEITALIGKMLTIDGASGGSGGEFSKLSDYGIKNQSKEFLNTSGLAEIQGGADSLEWTRGMIDLKEGVSGIKVGQIAKNAASIASIVPGAILDTVGNSDKNKSGFGGLLSNLRDRGAQAFNDVTNDAYKNDITILGELAGMYRDSASGRRF